MQTLTAPVEKQKSRSFKALKPDDANSYKTGTDLDDFSFFISSEDSLENLSSDIEIMERYRNVNFTFLEELKISTVSFTYELKTLNLEIEIEPADSIEKTTIKQINGRKDISATPFHFEIIGQK